MAPIDICLGRGICSLRMKNGNQDFLYYMMKYYVAKLKNKESGTVFGAINKNDIADLEIDIPCNVNTQKKIANYLVKDRKSTRLNSSHANISYAVFCLKKKNKFSLILYSPSYTIPFSIA